MISRPTCSAILVVVAMTGSLVAAFQHWFDQPSGSVSASLGPDFAPEAAAPTPATNVPAAVRTAVAPKLLDVLTTTPGAPCETQPMQPLAVDDGPDADPHPRRDHPVTLTLRASYPCIKAFLDAISAAHPDLEVRRLAMRRDPAGGVEARLSLERRLPGR